MTMVGFPNLNNTQIDVRLETAGVVRDLARFGAKCFRHALCAAHKGRPDLLEDRQPSCRPVAARTNQKWTARSDS